MSDRFESLDGGEVVSIQHETQVLSGHKTFKAGDLNDAIKSYIENAIPGWSEDKNDWFTDRGINCEALRFGSKGWQKGRIRLSLEFSPDDSDLPAVAANTNVPAAVNSPQPQIDPPLALASPSPSAVTAHYDEPVMLEQSTVVGKAAQDLQVLATEEPSIFDPSLPTTATTATMDSDSLKATIPIVGVATASAVAATMTIASPVETVGVNQTIPHHTDTILEEHQDLHSISHSGGLDEIAFDFENDRGRMIPNGIMELDLSDNMGFSDHDLLSFEANGMSDASEGFGNFPDLDLPENSGMLIDEVWHETSLSSWPKIS